MRRTVLKSPLGLPALVLVLGALTGCGQEASEEDKPTKPNIVFIMADDLGYGDLGVYGQQQIATPNIDKMAAEGMLFTQFYAGSTVCAPSRSALLTGLHTGHTRVRGNARVPLGASDTTFAELIQRAGYVTGLIGKWGLGEPGSTGVPNKKGFDYFYGYLNQLRAHNYYPDYVWENETVDSLDNVMDYIPETYAKGVGGIAAEKNTYIQDRFLEKTLQFLQSNKDSTFMLYLPLTLPHANNEAGYFGQSGMEIPDFGAYSDKDWPDHQKGHAAMISRLDKDVGTILDKLRELGLSDNTLVIFTSDNGPHDEGGADHTFFDSNGPLRGLKRDLFEGGIRVPMIASWPGKIEKGSKSDYIGAFWDVLPTFVEAAEIDSENTTDGISFLPSLLGKQQKEHSYLYWEFYEGGGKQAVRMDKWKCIVLNINKSEQREVLLFDLSNDLAEEQNVADQFPEVVAKALKLMETAHKYDPDFHFDFESSGDN
ncbi:MAG: arylsulfatase [Imperialibacter sp.]|uniref:arylsulfatase n=1 Tax=Imperialibacter sp. TaxID=2038411 RepID=UPI0032EC8F13